MFVKLQLDTNCCFPLLGSTKTLPNNGLSVSPVDKVEHDNKDRKCVVLQSPNGEGVKKRFGEVFGPARDRINGGGVHEPRSKRKNFVKNPDKKRIGKASDGEEIVKRRDFSVKFRSSDVYGVAKKVPSKCSKKWMKYGGCIPAILQALDEVEDLDEALKPWEGSLNNKERSIILKEQLSWERALEIFEWFKIKGCYELNVIHYNIMLRILGKARKWSHVEGLWSEMNVKGIAPTNSTYGTLIDTYSKGGLKEEALLWLEKMKKQGMEPDEVTMGIVVQMYKEAGEFQKAGDVFKKWSEGSALQGRVCLNSHAYNTMIDMYGKAGRLKEASKIFSQMLREGIAPTTVTFNTMIHICGNQDRLEEVASLMEKMEDLRCPPDTRTYNIIISLHAKHNNINMATEYFNKMKEASLQPDLVSYRTLLYAYSIRQMVCKAEDLISEMDEKGLEIDEYTQSALTRMYIEAGQLEKSCMWFRRFHLAGSMSSECYSANIDAYGEHGHIPEAEKVFLCCQEGKKLSVLEFNVMIKAYGVVKFYSKACQLFDTMEFHGIVPDKCSFSSLIQILATADMPQIAKSYLSQLELAEKLYDEMVGFGVQPDVIVFGILINAFADVGSVKEALGYVDAMKKADLPGNTVIYNSLIKLYTKVGFLKEAEETRNFQELEEKGNANEFTYAMMLCMYKKLGRFEEAVRIAKQMRDLGLLTDLLSYNHVLGLYSMYGRFKEVMSTFKEMTKASIQPDECTFRALAVVLVKSGVSKQAVGKLEVTVKKDAQSGLQRWMSALSSVIGVDGYDDF
ncbi:hypothetical protein FNV43_RR01562 [Rhamnella rubrinervis]|uniref:Pentatricopeptide repeat-containing protein n=1 Tax=Rhamnella rubrinervis TaxID=2594499 RepID=A0A8K0MT37_9ROSA|nr:hypothetical protein FNV43_RR01562 [Rhamnella rubrinervis]